MNIDNIRIIMVDDAAFFAAHLFKLAFNERIPVTPVHYVAFAQVSPAEFETVGYYHVDYRTEYALVGGLCVAPDYRDKGLGEKLSVFVFEQGGARKAFFSYTGNPVSARIALRIGYEETAHQHLFVRWLNFATDIEKERLIAEVAALGPF